MRFALDDRSRTEPREEETAMAAANKRDSPYSSGFVRLMTVVAQDFRSSRAANGDKPTNYANYIQIARYRSERTMGN